MNAVAHRHGIGKWPEILVFHLLRAAMEGEPRTRMSGQNDIGIGLIVPEQNVVLGREALDEIVFEQQRFGFGAGDGGLDRLHLGKHQDNARRKLGLLEIRGNALFEIARLADVEYLAGTIQHAVHPRQMGQAGK